MRLYQFTEVVDGLWIDRTGPARIPQPSGCPWELRLSKQLQTLFAEAPPGWNCLQQASFQMTASSITFEAERNRQRRSSTQALVRIATAAGAGGRIWLTSTAYSEVQVKGRVERVYAPFPSVGISPFCSVDSMNEVDEGVEFLDMLIVMNPGSALRLKRSGELAGSNGPEFCLRWTGNRLNAYARGECGLADG